MAAPSRTCSPVPSPEPGHDPHTSGPNHPILQKKGAFYCMELEATVFGPQTGGRQGSWSLQSTKVSKTYLRNSHTATLGRGSAEPACLVLERGAPRGAGKGA